MRGKTVECKCHCGATFTARVADRKRGWAKSCSKSCAATKSNRETGKYHRHRASVERETYGYDPRDDDDMSWDAHKH